MDENRFPPPAASSETLAELFYRTVTLIARASHHHGHTEHAQMRVLALLRDRHSMNQSELLEMFHVRSASLSEIVGKLEQRGFIERERAVQDRRNFVLTITGQGSAAATANEDARRNSMEALFASLSREERQHLAELLDKIVRDLGKGTSEPSRHHAPEVRHQHGRGQLGHFGRHGHGRRAPDSGERAGQGRHDPRERGEHRGEE
jgi:DNA-binding MarR family transcriptional regulator